MRSHREAPPARNSECVVEPEPSRGPEQSTSVVQSKQSEYGERHTLGAELWQHITQYSLADLLTKISVLEKLCHSPNTGWQVNLERDDWGRWIERRRVAGMPCPSAT